MSCSGRLVIQMNRLEWLDCERFSTKFRTFSRADGVPLIFGHSSRASIIMYVGSCPGSSFMLKTPYDIAVWLEFRRLFFFFQAEDGIRDHCVTGVQTCALPI